ncbi:MAG: ATP-binding cassette domain-containing protein [Anaerolineae bacterium]|nr:ATP-binding cassette domain-containing protein [Anaerolineae bacterium]
MRVDLRNVCKRFGPVQASDSVTLTFEDGLIHALLGENGAGKSTLMKILSGFYTADSGQIVLAGKPAVYDTPAGAIAHGVGMLHQDPLDFAPFSVLENFIYGQPGGLLQKRGAARDAFVRLAGRIGFDLNPDAYADTLTIGQRQQLEILRLISLGVRVLILDEPTTGISAEQKNVLFDTLRRLAHDEGLNLIFVSHKLEEVEELCDDISVLRHGQVVCTQAMPCPTEYMVEMMFGQKLVRARRPDVILGDPALQVRDLTVSTARLAVERLNFEARAGEVIGLAGLDGSGQKLFLRACAGLQRVEHGRVVVAGRDLTGRDYHTFMRAGVIYGPAGRLEEGLVGGLTLAEHIALADPKPRMWLDWAGITARTRAQIARFNIKGRAHDDVRGLSGGNQQRALLALTPPNLGLLLLEHPTRGLDVESAVWVWGQLLARRAEGTAILFISADLDEIMDYSDRVLVFFNGQVTEIAAADTCVEDLGYLIGGKAIGSVEGEA